MPPSTRDLLASVLGERPSGPVDPLLTDAAPTRPEPSLPLRTPSPVAVQPDDRPAGPWRVTARMHGGQVQISNNRESRVVRKEQVEVYLRGQVSPGGSRP